MNNMYDILAKMNLLEGKGHKPDFLDLDKDGDKKEPMAKAAKEKKVDESMIDEVGYSAKAARAGKDIGKPGKAFAQIAKSAGERYGSKERGEKVAGAVLAKLRAKKESVEPDGDVMDYLNDKLKDFDAQQTDESALQAYLGKKKYGEQGMKALQKAGREGASKEKMNAIRTKYDKMDEADMEEGNKFAYNVIKAKAAGLKKADLDGDGDMETVREYEFDDRDDFDRRAKSGDTVKTSKGTLTKTDKGVRHEKRHEEEPEDRDDDDTPKKKGRPKGTKRAIGAKVKGTSKLHSKPAIKETDLEEDYDQDEYDEEGEMAKSQSRTIADAAEELQRMLGDNENLPEWVQKKITLAQSYIDSARDYLKANRPGDEMMAEKAVSKSQRAAAGIAYAAKKGDIPKSELRGASKEMAKMATGELKKFAKTKEKGLPEKKKEESVEETTVAGSVAVATDTPKGKKGGMVFGKGVYESQIAESFDKKLKTVLTEGISINASQGEDGQKTLTVNATDEDAIKLAQILQLAGMPQGQGYQETCSACGQTPCGCEEGMAEGEYANSPEVEESDTDTMVNTLSGGLNGKKSTGQTTIPVIASQLSRQMSQVREETETRLWDLYKKYEG